MLRNTMIAAVIASAGAAGSMAPAEAQVASLGSLLPSVEAQASANILPAAYMTKHKWVYSRRLHGPRFHYRHGRYVHFYRGYWYARPWWRLNGPAVAVRVSPHVRWCMVHHFRYNPRTDMFTGRDGLRHACIV